MHRKMNEQVQLERKKRKRIDCCSAKDLGILFIYIYIFALMTTRAAIVVLVSAMQMPSLPGQPCCVQTSRIYRTRRQLCLLTGLRYEGERDRD